MVKYGQIEQSDVLYAFKRRGFGEEIGLAMGYAVA